MKKTSLLFSIILFLTTLQVKGQTKSFMDPPEIIKNPKNVPEYSSRIRKFTGISSMTVTPEGRLWATWYSGITPGEDTNNYVVLATSTDKGNSWEEVLVVDPDGKGPVRSFDPEIWIAPDNSLWLFWAQHIKEEKTKAGVWAIKTYDMESSSPEWTTPTRITDGVMMCKPTVLSTGEWILPVSTWFVAESAKAVVSADKGKTWKVNGGCTVPEDAIRFDEHMFVEKKDGSLWLWIRTKKGIGESISKDKGKTWTPLKYLPIKHTNSRFFVRRLQSGNLLLVKHGPINEKTDRTHLMAFISKDDGETWSKGLLIDERYKISYPDGQQSKDGYIHITYDYNRKAEQTIYYTKFKEEDILSGDYDSKIMEVFRNRKIISKGGEQ